MVVAMPTPRRLNRDQFFARIAEMDQADLRKALWTLYWRGGVPVRERIEDLIEPDRVKVRTEAVNRAPDAGLVLAEVTEFAALARSGSYLAGDRRVSPKERSQWRHTFRRLTQSAQEALRGEDVETAASAVTVMVELACETKSYDYFRSDDPVEAARFVVSDAVAATWARRRDAYGADRMIEQAAVELVRWESRYGWTRGGDGWVSERERSLASVLAGLLIVPDLWTTAAGSYLYTLDRIAAGGSGRRPHGRDREERAGNLSEWNALLIDRLAGSEHEELLDRLVTHPALAGPELTFVRARLAYHRDDLENARDLVRQCLKLLPGHRNFLDFAAELDEELPPRAARQT